MQALLQQRLSEIRRSFHRHPEPAWREFETTARIVEELRQIAATYGKGSSNSGATIDIAVGPDTYDPADRMAVPADEEIQPWFERARNRGVDEDLLSKMAGGNTGAVARLERGDGPAVGLRVDIDGLFIEESSDEEHAPAEFAFESEHEETMHACGHDAHMTWGLATFEAVAASDFEGTFTVFFQPAEETSGGGYPMANGEYAADLDYFFAVHVGLDHPTGEVVAGIKRPLAMCHVEATYDGTSAHAGKSPNEGDNAMQALGTAIQNVYAIPRHGDGMTRINVGQASAGTASNVIAEHATLKGEARGETTELMEYTKEKLLHVVRSAGEMHGCDVTVDVVSESPRADSSPELIELVADVARPVDGVDSVVPTADFGASEDATFLMQRVQEGGGLASYLIVGTDHPSSHHTSRFDVDERSLDIGVGVLTNAVLAVREEEP